MHTECYSVLPQVKTALDEILTVNLLTLRHWLAKFTRSSGVL